MKKIVSIIMITVFVLSASLVTTQTDVQAYGMRMTKKKMTMKPGKKKRLHVEDTNYYYGAYWWSSNEYIASVNQKGRVKAKQAGSCTIYARTHNRTFKCKVKVKVKIQKPAIIMCDHEDCTFKLQKVYFTDHFDDNYWAIFKLKCVSLLDPDYPSFSKNVYFYKGNRIVGKEWLYVSNPKPGKVYREEVCWIPNGTTKIAIHN